MSDQRLAEERNERFQKATENFKRIEKKIAPFIKRKGFKVCSTTGKWHETSAWLRIQDEENHDQTTGPC
jgi:hypothetical protein